MLQLASWPFFFSAVNFSGEDISMAIWFIDHKSFVWRRLPEFWRIAHLARRSLRSSVDPLMLVLQLQWVPRATTADLVPPSGVSLLHMYKALYVWLIYRREFDSEPCVLDCMSCWREFLIAADSASTGCRLTPTPVGLDPASIYNSRINMFWTICRWLLGRGRLFFFCDLYHHSEYR